jgi:hypothetical protein
MLLHLALSRRKPIPDAAAQAKADTEALKAEIATIQHRVFHLASEIRHVNPVAMTYYADEQMKRLMQVGSETVH